MTSSKMSFIELKIFCVILGVILVSTVSASTNAVPEVKGYELAVVDSLIARIQDDTWQEEDVSCQEKTLDFLHSVKNLTLWATWLWESNQFPVGNLYGSTYQMGNFDQCMNPPWLSTHPNLRTQYCTAEMRMTDVIPQKGNRVWSPYDSTENYMNTASKYGMYYNKLYWGVCVPAECGARAVGKLLRHMYSGSQYAQVAAAPRIVVEHCQRAGENQQYSPEFYIFITNIAILFGIALASTVYRRKVNNDDQHPGFTGTIINAFCLKRNYNQLMKENAREIHVMNGIRFLTACLIISLHQGMFLTQSPVVNHSRIEEVLESLFGIFSLHLEIVVDTFFAMSGLLLARGLAENTGRQNNLVFMLLRRYIRLLGPLTASIFYMMSVFKYTGSGPFWEKAYKEELNICAKTWKLSLLMLSTDFEDVCCIVNWYISCDYQLAILATVLFYFYQKDKKLGYAAFGTASFLSFLVPAVFTYWHRLPVIPFHDVRTIMDIRHQTLTNWNYTGSYVHASAYLIGIAMGYFMSVFKPADNRRAVSTKWSIIGTVLCVVIMSSMMGLGMFFFGREYNVFEVVVAASLNRAIWAFAICCLIAFCEYGTVPIISEFLSMSPFRPLSRLAYGMYVIHPFIMLRIIYSTRTPLTFCIFTLITEALAAIVVSACFSFCMWLLIEAPCINLSKALFANNSRTQEPNKQLVNTNGIAKLNGFHEVASEKFKLP